MTRRFRRQENPSTPEDWQDAIDAAEGALTLHSARHYGLVTGGPTVHVERCVEILREGEARGIRPSHDAVERFVAELLAAHELEAAASRGSACETRKAG